MTISCSWEHSGSQMQHKVVKSREQEGGECTLPSQIHHKFNAWCSLVKKIPVWILVLKSKVVRSTCRVWRKAGGGIVCSAFFPILNTKCLIFILPFSLTAFGQKFFHFILPYNILPLNSATISKWLCGTKISENLIKATKEGSWLSWLLIICVLDFQVPLNALKTCICKNCWNHLKIRVCILEIRVSFFKVWII